MNRKRRKVHFNVESEVDFPEGTYSLTESGTAESQFGTVPPVAGALPRDASCSSEDFSNEPEVCYGGVRLPHLIAIRTTLTPATRIALRYSCENIREGC